MYGRLAYRFNLERDPASRHEIQAAGPTGPRNHTYLTLGTYYLYGRSVQRTPGLLSDGTTPVVLTAHEPFYRAGGDFDFNYRDFNIYGLFMYGHDQNLLPFTPAGFTAPTTILPASPATFSGGFIQADYLIYPWMMAIMRWDRVDSTADQRNANLVGTTSFPAGVPFYSPFSSTRNRFTPGIQFLIHANIKTSFEYQVRPQQIVYQPGTTTKFTNFTNPFRTNTAVAALEFVY